MMAAIAWTKDEERDFRELYPVTDNREIPAILNSRHGNNRSLSAIKNRAHVLGLSKAEGHKHPMPPKFWTKDRREWFITFVPGHEETEIRREFERLFGIPLTREQVKSAKYNFGVQSGTHGGRFEKGQESWCKGMTWDEFMPPESQERCRQTQFKPGNIPHNAIGIEVGSERIDAEGYVWVKIAERKTFGTNDNWLQKSHIAWEEAHGEPVPEDCAIVFANHDKQDFRPENLVAVPRSVWAVIARNGYEYNDAASLQACMNLAKLKAAIYDLRLAPRECRKCGQEFEPRYPNQATCDVCMGKE